MSFLTLLLPAIALLKVKDLAVVQPHFRKMVEQVDEFGGYGVASISPVEDFACRGENDTLHRGGHIMQLNGVQNRYFH